MMRDFSKEWMFWELMSYHIDSWFLFSLCAILIFCLLSEMSFRCQRWGYFFLFGEVWNLRQLPDTILIFVVVAAAVLKILWYRFCPSGPECWKLNVKIRTSPLLTDFPSALHNGHQHDILARILQALIHMPLAVIHGEVTATLPGVFSALLLISCSDVITMTVVVGLSCPAPMP